MVVISLKLSRDFVYIKTALAVYYQSGFAGLMMTDDSDSLMSGFVGAKTLTANSKLRGPVLNSVELEVDEISLYVKQDC